MSLGLGQTGGLCALELALPDLWVSLSFHCSDEWLWIVLDMCYQIYIVVVEFPHFNGFIALLRPRLGTG